MHFGAIFAAQCGPHRKNPLLPANDRTIRAAFVRVNDAPTLRRILHRSGTNDGSDAALSSSIQNHAQYCSRAVRVR
jgi:hypothetical protein